jgi:large subunit ribosomal protein L13
MKIDAKGLIAGRLASNIAKNVINGETVVVINASNAVIVGTEKSILPKYKQRVDAAVKSNPHYGPKYDRIPSKMLRRMVRGMLPNKSRTREKLLKQIKVYNDTPKSVGAEKAETIEKIKYSQKGDFMYLGDVAKALGGKW